MCRRQVAGKYLHVGDTSNWLEVNDVNKSARSALHDTFFAWPV